MDGGAPGLTHRRSQNREPETWKSEQTAPSRVIKTLHMRLFLVVSIPLI